MLDNARFFAVMQSAKNEAVDNHWQTTREFVWGSKAYFCKRQKENNGGLAEWVWAVYWDTENGAREDQSI